MKTSTSVFETSTSVTETSTSGFETSTSVFETSRRVLKLQRRAISPLPLCLSGGDQMMPQGIIRNSLGDDASMHHQGVKG